MKAVEYVVEAIVDEKRGEDGAVDSYLVKWEGWDEPTWEIVANLTNCPDKIAQFKKSQQKKRKRSEGDGDDDGGDGDEWDVEEIRGERRSKIRGRYVTQYLVKWEGWDKPTWEAATNLTNCKDKVYTFKRQEELKRNVEKFKREKAELEAEQQENESENENEKQETVQNEVEEINKPKGIDIFEFTGDSDSEDESSPTTTVTEADAKTSLDLNTCCACKRDTSTVSHRCDVCGRRNHPFCGIPLAEGYSAPVRCNACVSIAISDTRREEKEEKTDSSDHETDCLVVDTVKTTVKMPAPMKRTTRVKASIRTAKKTAQARKAAQETSVPHRAARKNNKELDGFLDSDYSDSGSDGDEDDEESPDDPIIVEKTSDNEAEDDDEDETEPDALAGPHKELTPLKLKEMSKRGWAWTYYGDSSTSSYQGLDVCEQDSVLTDDAMAAAELESPLALFFFFMPKSLWKLIAHESNRYEKDTRGARIDKYNERNDRLPGILANQRYYQHVKTIKSFAPIRPEEILHVIALLIARGLCPYKIGIEQHWATVQKGAVPAGCWSSFIPRQRFRDILRHLHFTDNNDKRAKLDRAWKIRSVVDTLQHTFARGMRIGKWVAFDEMVIPSRCSRNAVRIYLKNKPHKYGTKLFAVCCGVTKYCARIEVYCGKRQDTNHVDTSGGPVAVVRNLKALWPTREVDRKSKRIIITDREYTSVSLAARLHHMGFYNIGTISSSRLGFPDELKYKSKRITKNLVNQRGKCQLMRCLEHPDIHACSWLDNKPVYFICSGGSTKKTTVRRREKNGASAQVSCPQFIEDYNTYMNGVDAHDQLRLQRYSVQRAIRQKKYYKSLFLGLVDMALVNSFVVYREYCRFTDRRPLSQAKFRTLLQQEMLQLGASDFVDRRPQEISSDIKVDSPSYAAAAVSAHELVLSEEKRPSGGWRFRVCKVCSVLHKPGHKATPTTRWYCKHCSSEKGRVYLCNVVQRSDEGNQLTCFQTWHQLWKNGTEKCEGKRIRIRKSSVVEPTTVSPAVW